MNSCLLWALMHLSLHSRRSSEAEIPHLPDEGSSYAEITDYVAQASHETVLQIHKISLRKE
jgi:hypothetical protein